MRKFCDLCNNITSYKVRYRSGVKNYYCKYHYREILQETEQPEFESVVDLNVDEQL